MQRTVQTAGLLQTANLVDAEITSLLDIRGCESHSAIGVVELLSAFTRSPLRTERRDQTVDLVEVNAIAAQIWTATGSVLHAAAGNDFGDNLRKFANAEVFVVAAHIESLVVNGFARCFEHGHNRGNDVADVDDGPPGCAVALDVNPARSKRRRY